MDTHYNFLFRTYKSRVILCNFSTLSSALLFGSSAQAQKVVITDVCYSFFFFF